MLPSSSRVKLNRVALKDSIGVNLGPRRRRVASSQNDRKEQEENRVVTEAESAEGAAFVPSNNETVQTGPEHVAHTAGNIPEGEPGEVCVGAQKAERRNNVETCGDNDSMAFKQEGPYSKGKYQQTKPNTRSKCRLVSLDRLCDLRFTWGFCTGCGSTEARSKQTEVKPGGEVSEMSHRTGFSSEAPSATSGDTKKSSVAKSAGSRCKSRRGNIKRKPRVTPVAKGGRDRGSEGQTKVKARSTGRDPRFAAAAAAAAAPQHTGQVRTRSIPGGLSNFDRNAHPSPTELAGSEGSLRQAVRVSRCDLFGKGQNNSSPEQPTLEVKIKKENTVISKKIIIWIDQYPKVALCNIAQNCDALCQNCGYVLPPDVLKTKVVHCFKQDMRAGFRFRPGCLEHNEHKRDDFALAEKRELVPMAQSEKSDCPTQNLTEHQRDVKKLPDAQTLSSHTTCCFLKSWTSEGSATCSASFLQGKRTIKGECSTDMWDSYVEGDPGSGSRLLGAEIHRQKRIKLGDSVNDGILPSTPDLESNSCKLAAKMDSRDQEKTCFWMSDDHQSCLEHTVGVSSTIGSAVKENCVKTCGEIDSPTKADAVKMSSELFCPRNEVHTDELESCTCQRVRAYFRKKLFSCARTYMSWPFSNSGWTRTACAGTTAGPAESADLSTRDNSDTPKNQNQPGSPSNRSNVTLPNAPTGPTSCTTQQFSHHNEEKREEDGQSILAERHGTRHENMSSYSSDSKNMEVSPHLMEAEESLASLPSEMATLSDPSQGGREPGADAPKTDSSRSTPSPSALGLSDWDTATILSSKSSPFTHGDLSTLPTTPSSLPPSSFLLKKVKSVGLADASLAKCMVKAVEKPLFHCEEIQMTSPHDSDSFYSCESPSSFPQDEQESEEFLTGRRSQSKLEPYYNASAINHNLGAVKERSLHNILRERCVETDSSEFMLPAMLSPVTTPQGCSRVRFLPQCPGCSDEEEINKDTSKHMLPGCDMPQTVSGNNETSKDFHVDGGEGVSTDFKTLTTVTEPQSSPSNDEYVDDGNKEGSQDESDNEDDVDPVKKISEQSPSDPKIKGTLVSGVLTEPFSSPSNDEGDGGCFSDGEGQPRSAREEGSSPSEISGSERDHIKAEAAGDTQQVILDEVTAYEQDILLVDVIQFDPELFENLPQKSLLKLGPVRVTEALKTRPVVGVKTLSPRIDGASLGFEQRLTPIDIDFHCNSPDITEESNNRPWRPHCSRTPSKMQCNTWPATVKQTKAMVQFDANNSPVNRGLERSPPVQRVSSLHNHIPSLVTIKNGPWITNPANMAEFRRQNSNTYCRQYFSESLSCGFKICRFQHVPVEGDEKFCMETVIRFIKNPICLQKAGAVFTGYYQNNPPGVYFSTPVLLSLLWSLLKASMVPDVFSVLSISVAHKIVPSHEFLLALFNIVREKGLMGFVPELVQLTFKMASAGLVLSLDCLDCVKNTPEFQQTVHPNSLVPVSGNHKLSTSAPFPEYLNLAHAIVEIELCTKQEDWRRMGKVFRSICQSSQPPNQVERISGRIAIALLSESKDKMSLPFSVFAEMVCQTEDEDSLSRGFLGRIGVSLMLRYHKTHQWAKGRRVVEVLSISKVTYSTLKGLFGNEDGASRCYLVTVATELFLLSGSVEGALNKLRENKWFLSSSSWPCEPADLESRTRVLLRLAEKTSHRDTLDVLCNLPGLKEPNDLIDVSRYIDLFNSHLQVCMDRQMLPVASDTVDFMLSKSLAVDHAVLQVLFHKLGKQNLWLRAREVFRRSLSVGNYPGLLAPPGVMALIIPCRLGEVELALTFEMFITVNAASILSLSETTTSCLNITLKRTQSCESEYLSAGSRLLSAACIPQPKLIIHYRAVNASQEQVFTLDISSARCWLRHNHLWANEMWTH